MQIHASSPRITSTVPPSKHLLDENWQASAFKQFKKINPPSINFEHLLSQLRASFGGAWAGSHLHSHEFRVAHPVFTHNGDFLLELLPGSSSAPDNGLSLPKNICFAERENGANGVVAIANGSRTQYSKLTSPTVSV